MNGQNALIVSIGVFVGFVAGLVASKMTAGSNNNEKIDEVDTVSDHLPPQTTKRNSIFHQPGSEWNRGKRVSISYTTQQADLDSPHRPRKLSAVYDKEIIGASVAEEADQA